GFGWGWRARLARQVSQHPAWHAGGLEGVPHPLPDRARRAGSCTGTADVRIERRHLPVREVGADAAIVRDPRSGGGGAGRESGYPDRDRGLHRQHRIADDQRPPFGGPSPRGAGVPGAEGRVPVADQRAWVRSCRTGGTKYDRGGPRAEPPRGTPQASLTFRGAGAPVAFGAPPRYFSPPLATLE